MEAVGRLAGGVAHDKRAFQAELAAKLEQLEKQYRQGVPRFLR